MEVTNELQQIGYVMEGIVEVKNRGVVMKLIVK